MRKKNRAKGKVYSQESFDHLPNEVSEDWMTYETRTDPPRQYVDNIPERETYLRKRHFERAAHQGFREAAKGSMERMGYLVLELDGWIVKMYHDGKIEKIEELKRETIPFRLD